MTIPTPNRPIKMGREGWIRISRYWQMTSFGTQISCSVRKWSFECNKLLPGAIQFNWRRSVLKYELQRDYKETVQGLRVIVSGQLQWRITYSEVRWYFTISTLKKSGENRYKKDEWNQFYKQMKRIVLYLFARVVRMTKQF